MQGFPGATAGAEQKLSTTKVQLGGPTPSKAGALVPAQVLTPALMLQRARKGLLLAGGYWEATQTVHWWF